MICPGATLQLAEAPAGAFIAFALKALYVPFVAEPGVLDNSAPIAASICISSIDDLRRVARPLGFSIAGDKKLYVVSKLAEPLPRSTIYTPSNVPASDLLQRLPEEAKAAATVVGSSLLLSGQPQALSRALAALHAADRPRQQYTVDIAVAEVASGSTTSNGLAALQLRLGGIGLDLAPAPGIGSGLSLQGNAVQVIADFLSTDSSANIINRSSIRVIEDVKATITSGNSVPVLSSLSIPQGVASPIQSIEYRDSGFLFNITASSVGDDIQLVLTQEISDFQITQTGIEQSPTLSKRSVSTTFTQKPGETIVFAGLTSKRTSKRASSFFGLKLGKADELVNVDVVLALSVSRVQHNSERDRLSPPPRSEASSGDDAGALAISAASSCPMCMTDNHAHLVPKWDDGHD